MSDVVSTTLQGEIAVVTIDAPRSTPSRATCAPD